MHPENGRRPNSKCAALDSFICSCNLNTESAAMRVVVPQTRRPFVPAAAALPGSVARAFERTISMTEFARHVFSSDFMPHGACFLRNAEILWLRAISDSLITLSYFLIPVALLYFVRQRHDLPFHWIFLLFGCFILGCGATHVSGILTLWHGTYRFEGVVKASTAGAITLPQSWRIQ
jgi:hypothetical protein